MPVVRSPAISVLLSVLVCAEALSDAPDAPRLLRGHSKTVFCLAFSPDGSLLVSGSGDQTIRLWRLQSTGTENDAAEQLQRLLDALDHSRFVVRQAAFLELASRGDEIKEPLKETLRTTKSAEVRLRVRHLLAMLAVPAGMGHEGDVRGVAFSSDGRTIASACRDNLVLLWSGSTGRAEGVFQGHSDGVWAVAFAPGKELLASAGGDQTVRLWNVARRRSMAIWEGHESTVQDVAFSPDGTLVASAGGFDKTVRLWEVDGGAVRALLSEHDDAVLCLVFSPDGRWLASGGYGSKVRVWRTRDWQLERTITSEQRVVRCMDFAPKSGVLAIAGDGQSVGLWNVTTGERTASFPVRGQAMYSARFAPDGRTLAIGGGDGQIRLWNVKEAAGPAAGKSKISKSKYPTNPR